MNNSFHEKPTNQITTIYIEKQFKRIVIFSRVEAQSKQKLCNDVIKNVEFEREKNWNVRSMIMMIWLDNLCKLQLLLNVFSLRFRFCARQQMDSFLSWIYFEGTKPYGSPNAKLQKMLGKNQVFCIQFRICCAHILFYICAWRYNPIEIGFMHIYVYLMPLMHIQLLCSFNLRFDFLLKHFSAFFSFSI